MAVFTWHTKQVGNDDEGELCCDVDDEVSLTRLNHRIKECIGRLVNGGFQVAHHAGREALVDEATVTSVHGRVHVEHHELLLHEFFFGQLVDE